MAPAQPPESIALKIKVPPGHLAVPPSTDGSPATTSDSFDLGSLPVSTTVGAVRQRIQSTVPTNPSPERQRLLYGGRALIDNEQTLADALNTKRDATQTEYVVHLLVKGEGMNAPPHVHHGSGLSAAMGAAGRPASTPPTGAAPQAQGTAAPQPRIPREVRAQLHQSFQQLEQSMAHIPPHIRQQAAARTQQAMEGRAGLPPSHMNGQPAMGGQIPGNFNLPLGMQVPPPQQQERPQQPGGGAPTSTNAQQPDAQPPPDAQAHPGHAHGHRRPISAQGFHIEGVGANGQRFQIHQQTFNVPHMPQGPHGQPMGMAMPMPFGGPMPQMPHVPHFAAHPHPVGNMGQPQGPPGMMPPFAMPANARVPGLAPQMPRQPGQSALDRTRENIAQMQRMVDELRNADAGTSEEERRSRLDEVRRRMDEVNSYVDPFSTGITTRPNTTAPSADGNTTTGRRSAPPPPPQPHPHPIPPLAPQQMFMPLQQRGNVRLPQTQTNQNPNDVTAYLLAGPQGPHALLFSPQHGTFHGAFPQTQPTPTAASGVQHPGQPPAYAAPGTPQPPQQQAQQQQPLPPDQAGQVAAAGALAQQVAGAQQLPGPQDPLGPLQPVLAHVWLLLRILIFAYFLLGANMGYTRPMILASIGMVFWAVRMGVLGDGAAVRRWWEGVVGVPRRPRGQGGDGNQAPAQQQPQQQNGGDNGGAAQQHAPQLQQGQPAQRQPMPTPEQVAQRLLNQQDARQQERRTWLREQIRPVERAVALFVASLWPGIGEAHVREQRRVREEEEVERRRVEEEERRRREEEAANAAQGEERGEVKAERSGAVEVAASGGEKSEGVATGGSS